MRLLLSVLGLILALGLSPVPLAAQSCTQQSFVGGMVVPQTVNPGSQFQLYCNYNDIYGYVYGQNCDSFAAWNGTSAVFNCTAPSTPGNYSQMCILGTGPPQNYCSRTDIAGTLTVTGGNVAVSVGPTSATLNPSQQQMFYATVSGASNTAVSWSVYPNDPYYYGSIGSDGLYSAPASVSSVTTVTVTATSVQDPSRSSSATITLQPGCTPQGLVSGGPIPSTVAPGASFQLACNYNAVYGYVYGNNCNSFQGWDGTTALFNCTAPSSPGVYSQACILGTGPPQNFCARNDTVGPLTVQAPSNVPSPWSTLDIGSVGVAGSANYSNAAFTVAGSGTAIWYDTDGYRFVQRTITGDASIVVRLATFQTASYTSKAGVMFRESLGPGSANVLLAAHGSGTVEMQYRGATSGGTAVANWGSYWSTPTWLKLSRVGNTFTAYTSQDGVTWTSFSSVTVNMSTATYAGMAVSAENNSAVATAVFDNVNVTAAPTVLQTITTNYPGLSLKVDGANCSAPCTFNWTPGSTHTVEAVAPQTIGAVQYDFANWSDNGQSTHVISPAESSTFTANYTATTTHTFYTVPSGWQLTIDSQTRFCAPQCAVTWVTGTNNHGLTAPAVSGYTFQSWTIGAPAVSGGTIISQSSSWSETARSSPTTYYANYVVGGSGPYTLTATPTPAAGGSVTPSSGSYGSQTSVSIAAQPGPGYSFSSWTINGASAGSQNPLVLTMDAPKTVTAIFTVAPPLYVSCEASPNPAILNQPVNLLASIQGGAGPYSFAWTGAVSGNTQSLTFTPTKEGGYAAKVTVNSTVSASCFVAVAHSALSEFRQCIGWNGTSNPCQLPAGAYIVPPPYGRLSSDGISQWEDYLIIRRSGSSGQLLTIKGTMTGGPGDTVLRRGTWLDRSGSSISAPDPGPKPLHILVAPLPETTNVAVTELTFDGNRYGAPDLTCVSDPNLKYIDLNLSKGGKFRVTWVDFINAPDTALNLSGERSVVLYSTFGEAGEITGSRATAILASGTYTNISWNRIRWSGTAAINLSGSGQIVYGNLLDNNRREVFDHSFGGQLYLEAGSSAAVVTANVIDGHNWDASTPPASGCHFEPNQAFAGVEAYGTGHSFYNNGIFNHTGSGMQFAGSNPTGQITVAGYTPGEPDDPPRYIENNAGGGIGFLGYQWCFENQYTGTCHATAGVTLDDVLVRGNAWGSVLLDNVSNNGNYIGFISGSCMSRNQDRDRNPRDEPIVHVDPVKTPSPVTNTVPSSYSLYRGSSVCPEGSTAPVPNPRTPNPGWTP